MGGATDYSKMKLSVSNPRNESEVKEATKKAWYRLVEDREYDYGHRGYTGTFAEKGGVVISYFPQLDDKEVEQLTGLVEEAGEGWDWKLKRSIPLKENIEKYFVEHDSSRKTYQKAKVSIDNLKRMNEQWMDKWGNALAITNGSIVIFMGMCSS